MKILFKFPSKSRPHKFFVVLDNITELALSKDYTIQVTLDIDDQSMATPEVRDRLARYERVKPYWGLTNSKIHAVNRDMEFAGEWDILIIVSDDFLFLKKGFDLEIIDDMKSFFPEGDGCLHYPDGTFNQKRLMTMNICDHKYYDRFGYIYHPSYLSVYSDDENTQRAQKLGKIQYIDNHLFEHNHHLFNKSEADALNRKNDGPNMYAHDLEVFNSRKPLWA